jgi:hypothetical protein
MKRYVLDHFKHMDFFYTIFLLENNICTQYGIEKICFKISMTSQFPVGIIEKINILPNHIDVYIRMDALLNRDNAGSLLRYQTVHPAKEAFIKGWFHQLMCRYYQAWVLSRSFLTDHLIMPIIGQNVSELSSPCKQFCQRYIYFLAQRQYSIQGLRQIMQHYFSIKIAVSIAYTLKQALPKAAKMLLSSDIFSPQPSKLNQTCLGNTIAVHQKTLRVHIYLENQSLNDFLPGGQQMRLLAECLNVFVPISVDIVIVLDVNKKNIAKSRLYSNKNAQSYYLGWTLYFFKSQDVHGSHISFSFKLSR